MIDIIKYGIIFNLSSSLQNIFFKFNDIDAITTSLLSSIIVILTTVFTNKDIQNDMINNHILDYFNKDGFILSLTGSIQYILGIYLLKKLPLSLTIPISSSWLMISIIFEKILLDIDFNYIKLFIMLFFMFGLFLVNYHHFNNKKRENINYLSIVLLLISVSCKAFQQIYIKFVSNKYSTSKIILIDFLWGLIFNILLCIINFKDVFKSLNKIKSILYLFIVVFITQNLKVYSKFNGIKKINIDLWDLISNLTIILSIIFGYICFNEKMNIMQIIGSIIMIFSIYTLSKIKT